MGSDKPRNSTRARKARSFKQKSRREPVPIPECPDDHDPLLRLSRAIALVETIEVAMRTHEESPELGPICMCLELACKKLARAHSAVDHALQGTHT
ncbi:MAG TPA: hypothetical protein VHC20_06745 [Candidatus Paceibacterota bacterium]|nr:hypothetical protein [Candidatus Paceibacterota bacterium]